MKIKSIPPTLALLACCALAVAVAADNDKHRSKLDSYGGTTEIKGKATGFFHLEEIDGRQWFITPEGNAFFGIGLSHLYSGESDLAVKNVYGGDSDEWLVDSFNKARAMGFNCALGSATSPERNLNGFVDVEKAEALFRENNFPYAVGVILRNTPGSSSMAKPCPIFSSPLTKNSSNHAPKRCVRNTRRIHW